MPLAMNALGVDNTQTLRHTEAYTNTHTHTHKLMNKILTEQVLKNY